MSKNEKLYLEALHAIAKMGYAMRDDLIDWQNIGKNAVKIARETVAGKCGTCGKPNHYQPEVEQ